MCGAPLVVYTGGSGAHDKHVTSVLEGPAELSGVDGETEGRGSGTDLYVRVLLYGGLYSGVSVLVLARVGRVRIVIIGGDVVPHSEHTSLVVS